MDVCLKNVDEEAWRKFKAHAAENGMKLGDYFKEVVNKDTKPLKSNWHQILYGPKPLKGLFTSEDYKKIKKEVREGFKLRY
ncbi:hypothetical protein HYY69_04440 [Candidatus Woesearchaeota archaeon]|nr:hypothetical protein [Candidatus Woesearchaeota archaeon]